MKRTIIKRLLAAASALFVLLCIAVYLWLRGHIPSFADTRDIADAKQIGVQPSSGRVWQYCAGFTDGVCYYRLHLSRSDFEGSSLSRLPRRPAFEKPRFAPIWWNPGSETSLVFGRGGLGPGTENIYIYDARRELLFARCET